MKEILFEHYNLRVEQPVSVFGLDGFISQNVLYCIVPTENWELDELYEVKLISDYLIQKGDRNVAAIVPTKFQHLTTRLNEKDIMIIRCPYYRTETHITGRDLAKFHKRGRTFPQQVSKVKRIGQWKYLWEKRLDQMELFWKEKVKQNPRNTFETLFVESFPYYIGLTENAIQYLVDTELDESPDLVDSGTVCFQRFSHQQTIVNPLELVIDHCTRDIAEYIRYCSIAENSSFLDRDIIEFLNDYERISPLSSFSWRLLYSRLLFPLHYFECIERYYLAKTEEEKKKQEKHLTNILSETSQHEHFLATFFERLGVTRRKVNIPNIQWLSTTRNH